MSLNTGSLVARTLILAEDVSDTDELFTRPELLIDIEAQPGHAAARWNEQRALEPGWSSGALELHLNGVLLSDARQWDDMWPLWSYLVAMVDEYLRDGVGQASFPNRPVHVVLRDREDSTFLTVGDIELDVHRKSFVPQLLDAAEGFFRWLAEICDEEAAEEELEYLAEIRETLESDNRF